MKVLIVGEFSGVAKNLAIGFGKLDIQTDLIGDGDGYKNISNSVPNIFNSNRVWRWARQIFKGISCLSENYDCVIFLSPFVFKYPLFLNNRLYESLISCAQNSILLACTSDSVWWRDYDPTVGRSPHFGSLKDSNGKMHRFYKDRFYNSNLALVKMVDRVVALAPEYKIAYQDHCENLSWVPFPYELVPRPISAVKRKYVYHGITRSGFKGSKYLLSMMEKFESGGLKSIVTEKLDYSEFLKHLHQSVLYLDQFFSHSPAMGALTALNFVPYVITGIQYNKENHDYFSECPAIDVFEDTDRLIGIISSAEDYEDQLDVNAAFLFKHHNPVKICTTIGDLA